MFKKVTPKLGKESTLWQKAESEVFGKGYGFNKDQIKAISEKIKSGTELTAEEKKVSEKFITEVAAHETEYILGTESFIDKLVAEKPSLARKIIDKILNLKKVFSKVESKSAKEQLKFLEKAESLYLAAARKAGNSQLVKYILSRSPEKEKSASDEKIRYAIKYPSFTKEDIIQNVNKLADMKPVANIDASKLEKTGKAPSLIFEEYFASLGNSIYSDVYGDISLGKSSVKSEIRHGITAEKIASIEAIPVVIEEGKVIFSKTKEGSDVERIVIAAPIKIGVAEYYMGVMLQRDTHNQRLYLHNVVAVETKEATTLSQDNSLTNWSDESNSRLFITIILQNAIDVKLKKQKSENNFNFSTEKSVENGDNGGLSEAVTRINEKKAQVTEKENTPEDNSDASEGIRFSLRYDDAIEQLESDTLDRSENTHLNVLDYTPQIYIDKASAKARGIIMAWDIAYLAMKKNGDIPGHYHGLGSDIMKALPEALKDPLYIVKQKNGRIAAVTKIVVKGKRAVFASIELETFKTTIQEGKTESKNYNMILTVTDAKPNYLQNTIFSGDVVYNKNKEDPAHFILRLKSLEKALPTYDHAESSNKIIPENAEKSNTFSENSSDKVSDVEKKAQVTEKENTPEDNSDASEGIRFSLKKSKDIKSNERLSYILPESIVLYTDEERKSIGAKKENLIAASYEDVIGFFEHSVSDKSNEGNTMFIGKLSDKTAEKIYKATGLNTFNKSIAVNSHDLRHMMKEHGNVENESRRNQEAISINNLKYVIETIVEPDDVNIEKNEKSGVVSLIFKKEIEGKITAITIFSEKRKALTLKTAWIIKKEQYISQPTNAEALVRTPGARSSMDTVHKNSILDSDKIVNSNSKNISDTDKNIKFSLKGTEEKPYSYKLSDGKVEKESPYSYVRKVYSKKETEGIINDVLSNYLSFGDTYGELSGKSKKDVINMLWERLNTAVPGRQAGVALDTAEYIIRESVVKSIFEDPNVEVYKDTVATLKPYLHKINLDGIKGDIKHRYDKDNSPYLLWGKRKGTNGVGADVIAMELENLGLHIEAVNEADIFFEIHEAYKNAVNELKKSAKTMLDYTLTAKERHQLKQDIAHRIHRAFDENGERKKVERFVDEKGCPTELSKLINEYEEKATEWRDKYLEQQEKHRLINGIFDKIKKLSDLEKGTFYNATQYKDNIFKTSIDQLIKIKHRSEINKSGTRRILGNLSEWYSKDNPMLSYEEGSIAEDSESFKKGTFDDDISSMIPPAAVGFVPLLPVPGAHVQILC